MSYKEFPLYVKYAFLVLYGLVLQPWLSLFAG